MAVRISNAAALVGLDAITALINVNGPGEMRIFIGAPPTNCSDADPANLLASHLFSADAFPDATDAAPGATAVANAIGDDISADMAGAPGCFRVYDGNGLCILQGTAGFTGDGTDCDFDKSPFAIGDLVKITAMTLNLAES